MPDTRLNSSKDYLDAAQKALNEKDNKGAIKICNDWSKNSLSIKDTKTNYGMLLKKAEALVKNAGEKQDINLYNTALETLKKADGIMPENDEEAKGDYNNTENVVVTEFRDYVKGEIDRLGIGNEEALKVIKSSENLGEYDPDFFKLAADTYRKHFHSQVKDGVTGKSLEDVLEKVSFYMLKRLHIDGEIATTANLLTTRVVKQDIDSITGAKKPVIFSEMFDYDNADLEKIAGAKYGRKDNLKAAEDKKKQKKIDSILFDLQTSVDGINELIKNIPAVDLEPVKEEMASYKDVIIKLATAVSEMGSKTKYTKDLANTAVVNIEFLSTSVNNILKELDIVTLAAMPEDEKALADYLCSKVRKKLPDSKIKKIDASGEGKKFELTFEVDRQDINFEGISSKGEEVEKMYRDFIEAVKEERYATAAGLAEVVVNYAAALIDVQIKSRTQLQSST